jgi:hypothetical protein
LGSEIALIGKPPSVMTTTSFQIFAIDLASLQRRATDYYANKGMTYEKVLELDRYVLKYSCPQDAFFTEHCLGSGFRECLDRMSVAIDLQGVTQPSDPSRAGKRPVCQYHRRPTLISRSQ